jgi:hypothetical protein
LLVYYIAAKLKNKSVVMYSFFSLVVQIPSHLARWWSLKAETCSCVLRNKCAFVLTAVFWLLYGTAW